MLAATGATLAALYTLAPSPITEEYVKSTFQRGDDQTSVTRLLKAQFKTVVEVSAPRPYVRVRNHDFWSLIGKETSITFEFSAGKVDCVYRCTIERGKGEVAHPVRLSGQ